MVLLTRNHNHFIIASFHSLIICPNTATSALLTRTTLGFTGFSWISCTFALLLRLNDTFAEFVAILDGDSGVEGCEMGGDTLFPVWEVGDGIGFSVICSDCGAFVAGLSFVELKSMDGCAIEKVGDAADVLDFKCHGLPFINDKLCFNFMRFFKKSAQKRVLLFIFGDFF